MEPGYSPSIGIILGELASNRQGHHRSCSTTEKTISRQCGSFLAKNMKRSLYRTLDHDMQGEVQSQLSCFLL
jgi:hypothetical protein